jgi:hypothetical protein
VSVGGVGRSGKIKIVIGDCHGISVPEIKDQETREGRKKPEKFDWGLGQIFAPKKILKIDFSKNFSLFCIFFFCFFNRELTRTENTKNEHRGKPLGESVSDTQIKKGIQRNDESERKPDDDQTKKKKKNQT